MVKVGQKEEAACSSSTALLEKEFLSIRETTEGQKSILIVDDEESVIGALSEFLSLRGYEVETALNSRQALALIHEKPFSIVISDLRMPGMSGVELLGQVMDVDPETVVVIMTGYASVQSAVDALKKGAYDYVMKPFSMHELEKTLRLGLEKRRLSRENLELSDLMRKMVEIDQIKSNIISTISHEFRTPLMSLKGYLSMLTKARDEGTPVEDLEKKWLHAMKDNLGRLEMLILNLLLMTEANTGDLLITDDEIDVSELVQDSISRLDGMARSKEISVAFTGSKTRIRGDLEKLRVAIGNVIENAIKFNLDAGTVKISVADTADPEGVRIVVSDTGIGIPGEKIASMFDCFTQVDMTQTRRFNGAGLGLPVAKAIVEAHGGRIGAESKPGRGSSFHIWLPKGTGA
jgi:two-component system sensor histidine kinase/response regulator